jgi:hypothetical protein
MSHAEPLLYRIDAWMIGLVLFACMVGLWEVTYWAGSRMRDRMHGSGEAEPDLGAIETAAGGLLALILAFSFSMAAQRFDRRQDLVVAEAGAIGTSYALCSVLEPPTDGLCRDDLRRYVETRIELFDARRDLPRVRRVLARGEELQRTLWAEVTAQTRAADTPSHALLLGGLTKMVELGDERVATLREIVPREVTAVTLLLCLGWAGFGGLAHGLRANRRRFAWIGFAVLVCLVILVSLDLDRPNRGFARPFEGQAVMQDVHRRM